jgi:CPA2 family monovalent cation:H+ antiporter-2
MTIEEANIRWLTGVSLVAIRRASGEQIDYPNPQTILQAGDRFLVVGEPEEQVAFNELARGEVAVPGTIAPCQWLLVSDNSPAAGKTLAQLHLRRQYGVQVQAVRREGKFIRFPDGRVELRPGDHLLLCGGSYPLNQLRQWISPLPLEPVLQVPVIKVPVSEALEEFLPLDSQREG